MICHLINEKVILPNNPLEREREREKICMAETRSKSTIMRILENKNHEIDICNPQQFRSLTIFGNNGKGVTLSLKSDIPAKFADPDPITDKKKIEHRRNRLTHELTQSIPNALSS